MEKLTQKKLDEMVAEAMGEREGRGEPDIVKKLKEAALKGQGEVTTA